MWRLLRGAGKWAHLGLPPLHSWALIPALPLVVRVQASHRLWPQFLHLSNEDFQPYLLGSSAWMSNRHLNRLDTELLISS